MQKKIIYDFVSAINEHNVNLICSLMSSDHVFIDSHGNEVKNNHRMRAAWEGYFQWFPDYEIEIIDILFDGNMFAAFGFASGTYKGIKAKESENHWRLPAAWKIIINENKIALWQVYADSKIPFDIINRDK